MQDPIEGKGALMHIWNGKVLESVMSYVSKQHALRDQTRLNTIAAESGQNFRYTFPAMNADGGPKNVPKSVKDYNAL